MTPDVTFICPVCGYDGLDERPWEDGGGSDEICPSCGTQFGYQDSLAHEGLDARLTIHARLRAAWIEGGMTWHFASIETPPEGWDPQDLLARLLATDTSNNEPYDRRR
jgi:hypothetical protein